MASDEGVIKFKCVLTEAPPPPEENIAELKHFRQLLYMYNLIGEDADGIGFGNISCRIKNTSEFIITGTQTGGLKTLESNHFTVVDDFNIERNTVYCKGNLPASSETLTHAALYKTSAQVNAVIHVHHAETWQKNIDKLPTTKANIEYGTPHMALEVMRLASLNPVDQIHQAQIIIMAGHKDGIIAYGNSLKNAFDFLMNIPQGKSI